MEKKMTLRVIFIALCLMVTLVGAADSSLRGEPEPAVLEPEPAVLEPEPEEVHEEAAKIALTDLEPEESKVASPPEGLEYVVWVIRSLKMLELLQHKSIGQRFCNKFVGREEDFAKIIAESRERESKYVPPVPPEALTREQLAAIPGVAVAPGLIWGIGTGVGAGAAFTGAATAAIATIPVTDPKEYDFEFQVFEVSEPEGKFQIIKDTMKKPLEVFGDGLEVIKRAHVKAYNLSVLAQPILAKMGVSIAALNPTSAAFAAAYVIIHTLDKIKAAVEELRKDLKDLSNSFNDFKSNFGATVEVKNYQQTMRESQLKLGAHFDLARSKIPDKDPAHALRNVDSTKVRKDLSRISQQVEGRSGNRPYFEVLFTDLKTRLPQMGGQEAFYKLFSLRMHFQDIFSFQMKGVHLLITKLISITGGLEEELAFNEERQKLATFIITSIEDLKQQLIKNDPAQDPEWRSHVTFTVLGDYLAKMACLDVANKEDAMRIIGKQKAELETMKVKLAYKWNIIESEMIDHFIEAGVKAGFAENKLFQAKLDNARDVMINAAKANVGMDANINPFLKMFGLAGANTIAQNAVKTFQSPAMYFRVPLHMQTTGSFLTSFATDWAENKWVEGSTMFAGKTACEKLSEDVELIRDVSIEYDQFAKFTEDEKEWLLHAGDIASVDKYVYALTGKKYSALEKMVKSAAKYFSKIDHNKYYEGAVDGFIFDYSVGGDAKQFIKDFNAAKEAVVACL